MSETAGLAETAGLTETAGMTLTVVGCSGSTSGPDSAASSYLVQAPWRGGAFSLLLDCGPGAFGALYRHLDSLRSDPAPVDAIGLSHLHPDHCLDLCAYYVASRYAPTAPWNRVDLYAPTGVLPRLARAYDPVPAGPNHNPTADLAETFTPQVWRDVQQIGPFRVRTAPVDHPVPCFAIRVEAAGRALVYSGDTGPCEALVELARGADLLLCEAAFMADPGNPHGLHLSGRQAAEHAARADVGRLVLTHIPPWHRPAEVLVEARPYFDGPIDLATSGASYRLVR